MGTITGMQIANRSWTKVNEATGGSAVRWPSSEALDAINDAQREIVNISGKANSMRATPSLQIGSSRQDLSAMGISDAISLMTVYASMNASTNARIRALTKRERAWLDDCLPTWHTTTGDPVHWVHDDAEPNVFWVYPQPATAMKVELAYAASPAPLANLNAAITLPDTYANAIQYFVLFSFYSKQTNYTANPSMAANYYQLFTASAGKPIAANASNETQGAAKAAGAAGV